MKKARQEGKEETSFQKANNLQHMTQHTSAQEGDESESGLALIIPKELAERYHLKPGDIVETIATENGLLVKPVEAAPRLAKEWEEALGSVMQQYRPALNKLSE